MTTKRVCISMPPALYEEAKRLVRKGRYASMSALIQEAIRRLLEREFTARSKHQRGERR